MLLAHVAAILDRDLRTLAREVEAYADERDLWRLPPGLPNSGGTLALHLAGNIQHYFGARLGGTDYVRDRPAEFALRNVSRADLLARVEAAREAVRAAAAAPVDLSADFPEVISDAHIQTEDYLVHLCTHFAFHLGQLDYHRRSVTGDPAGVGPMRPAELGSARPAGASR
jgi:Protein of unknown function (DUF664)